MAKKRIVKRIECAAGFFLGCPGFVVKWDDKDKRLHITGPFETRDWMCMDRECAEELYAAVEAYLIDTAKLDV